MGPYEILEHIGMVAYKLALPPSMSVMHNVFHVSMLSMCILDPVQMIVAEDVQLEPDLSHGEVFVAIMGQDV